MGQLQFYYKLLHLEHKSIKVDNTYNIQTCRNAFPR